MALMKYPSRSTLKRLSRAEVAERIERMGIELPPISTALPVWYKDVYDPLLCEDHPIEQAAWEAQHRQRQQAWHEAQDAKAEHPQAREMLFQECLKRAVQRAGLAELNKIIMRTLRDKEKVPSGCEYVSHWQYRIMTRLDRESVVIAVLTTEDRQEHGN